MKNKKRSTRFIDRTGQIFGRLIVIRLDKIYNKRTYWLCKCKCGKIVSIVKDSLVSGKTKSCGCLRNEKTAIRNSINKKTHGMFGTRFYSLWSGMKNRCTNTKSENYKSYGSVGIILHTRWLRFENFMADMYESYLKHVEEFGEKNTTIDRFPEQEGNYEPGNVRWATWKEQERNKRTSTKTDNYDAHKQWKQTLTSNLNSAIRRNSKTSTVERYLGVSLLQFKQYIELRFLPNMNWNNHGNGIRTWQLDHIIGCNNFDLSKEEDRLVCFNYTNYQPLWWEEHIKKSKFRKTQ